MNERVSIQYSVSIDDLGGEVDRLLVDAFKNLNSIQDEKIESETLSLRTIQKVDEIRRELANVDLRLGDAVNLINGYIAYKSQALDEQQIGESAERSQQSENEMGERLAKIRENLQELSDEDTAQR